MVRKQGSAVSPDSLRNVAPLREIPPRMFDADGKLVRLRIVVERQDSDDSEWVGSFYSHDRKRKVPTACFHVACGQRYDDIPAAAKAVLQDYAKSYVRTATVEVVYFRQIAEGGNGPLLTVEYLVELKHMPTPVLRERIKKLFK